MGENETDKQNLDGSETTVEEETTTSTKTTSGEEEDTEEGTDSDDKNDDDSNDKEEDEDGQDKKDDKKSSKSTSKDENKDEDEDKEPPTRERKSPIDFIKARQEKRAKKAEQNDSEEGDEDEDDGIDEADKKTFGKLLNKALQPLAQKAIQEEDDKEVNAFLKDNPDFKPYESRARKYMAHPSRKDVPIQEIFYGVAGKDLLKIGAKRAKIADDEAKKTRSAKGTGSDAGASNKSVNEMSKAELEAKQDQVRAKLADR